MKTHSRKTVLMLAGSRVFLLLMASVALPCLSTRHASALPRLASRTQDETKTDAQTRRLKRRWRVMVIVPETHISRPRIPDPAVETELSRQLIDAGYKVIDQDRIAAVRYGAVVDRILKGGPTARTEAQQLCRRFGADILVTGEAFTQAVTRGTQVTDIGTVEAIQCRSRVELRAIRMDTGEKFYADEIQKTGSAEPTEELSSKACLEQSASDISERLLARLETLSVAASQTVEIQVRGIGSAFIDRAVPRAALESFVRSL